MAIRINCYTLLIKRLPAIEQYFADSIFAYENVELSGGGTFRCDEHLVAVGSMNGFDLDPLIEKLKNMGLQELEDFEMLQMFDWKPRGSFLEAKVIDRFPAAWLKGQPRGEIKLMSIVRQMKK